MTFEERAAELHRLDAFAISLGLSDAEFVRIAQTAIAEGYAKGADPDGYLAEIRRRVVERGIVVCGEWRAASKRSPDWSRHRLGVSSGKWPALVRCSNFRQSWHTSPTCRRATPMSPKESTVIDHVVGIRIAALRKTRGLSQTALGEAAGVTFQQIQKYEMGQNRVGAGRLQVIAKFLDVPVSMLFSDDAETEEQAGAFEFLALPGAVELLKAFLEIEDLQLRRDVVALARTAARIRRKLAAPKA